MSGGCLEGVCKEFGKWLKVSGRCLAVVWFAHIIAATFLSIAATFLSIAATFLSIAATFSSTDATF